MQPSDQCFHTNLSPELICHGCGMRFLPIYEETPFGLWLPVLRAGLLGVGFFFFSAYASVQLNSLLFAAIFVSIAVFFLVRAIRSVTEKHIPRLLRVGKVGQIRPRGPFSFTATKPMTAPVAGLRFQMDAKLYGTLNEGDVVVVEFLRWSRLPTAWYRGR